MAPNHQNWAAITKHLFQQTAKSPPAVCNCNLTVNQDSQVSGAMKTLEVKLDKLVAQNLDKKVENLEKNSKNQLFIHKDQELICLAIN